MHVSNRLWHSLKCARLWDSDVSTWEQPLGHRSCLWEHLRECSSPIICSYGISRSHVWHFTNVSSNWFYNSVCKFFLDHSPSPQPGQLLKSSALSTQWRQNRAVSQAWHSTHLSSLVLKTGHLQIKHLYLSAAFTKWAFLRISILSSLVTRNVFSTSALYWVSYSRIGFDKEDILIN